MAKEFWLSLPVKDIKRSKDFFTRLGFVIKEGPGNTPSSAPLVVSDKKVVVMLFEEPAFKRFVSQEIADTSKFCEVLLSFDAASKEDVDAIAERAVEAGGKTSHKPYKMDGPMYGCVFSDPDGHKWNVLYMRSESK